MLPCLGEGKMAPGTTLNDANSFSIQFSSSYLLFFESTVLKTEHKFINHNITFEINVILNINPGTFRAKWSQPRRQKQCRKGLVLGRQFGFKDGGHVTVPVKYSSLERLLKSFAGLKYVLRNSGQVSVRIINTQNYNTPLAVTDCYFYITSLKIFPTFLGVFCERNFKLH